MTFRAGDPTLMPLAGGLSPAVRRVVRGAGILTGVLAVALGLHDAGVLGGPDLDDFFTVWVYTGIEVLVCVLVLTRAFTISQDRGAWLALGIGIAFYTAGDIYYALFLENAASVPTPSPADVGYLLFYPFTYVALARLVGAHVRDVHANVWLDGAIGGLTLAAVGAALVLEPVIHTTHGNTALVATNLAYPIGDLLLIVFVFGVFALTGWRPGRAWLLILLGLGITALADSVYLFQVAEGTYHSGTFLDALWPLGLSLLAFAAWSPPRLREGNPLSSFAVMVVPCFFGAVALFLLIRGNYNHLAVIPEVLAAAALLVAGLRFAVSFNDVRSMSSLREHQARTDYLTGLANRRHFYDQLNETIDVCRRNGTSFALLSIDLDRFKELNDTLGHYAGDQLLQQVGPRMQAVVRDGALARLGGDEFGVILRDESAAAGVAERIHRALARPFELDELTVAVQASIGIAVFPKDAQSTDGLLQRADMAMYQAKGERSRYFFYTPAADHSSRERLGMVTDLKQAVEQGGLVVHYQPQVDLRTNTVSGVEALVRWQHPERGLLGADAFVNVAEQIGVMRELTSSVLEQALGQHRAWLDEGRELNLAVNVSATNLLDAAFLGDLKQRMEHWRTPPGTLRLEITESVLIAEGSRVRRVIESLGDLGVLLSLDDFGTGYSPLSYLREMPVTEIKIDRSFVTAMMSDRDTATIVAAVIGLARRLGIEVVAEGIETAGQLEMLRGFEAPFAQGYLFSRPLPAQTVGRWLREDALEHIAEEVLAAGRLADVGGAPLDAPLDARPTAGALVWPGPPRRPRDVPIA